MNFSWNFFIDIGIISLALLLVSLVYTRVRFFTRLHIPAPITAGLLLLVFYNFLAPVFHLSNHKIGEMVFHLLNISFITLSLRQPYKVKNRRHPVVGTVIGILSQYALLTFVGFALALLVIPTLFPQIFTGFGLLMPLGFLLGPGQAYAIALPWEKVGWSSAGDVGLTFGAIGFLWAALGGFVMINLGLKKGWIRQSEPPHISPSSGTGRQCEESVLENKGLTLQITLILLIYLITFILLKGLTLILSLAGNVGRQFAESLWGISFVWGSLIALLTRKILARFSTKPLLDDYLLTALNNSVVNLMVAASFGAISLVALGHYWLPILVFSLSGGLLCFFSLPWICSRIFGEYAFHKTLILYGALTGTLPTGLVLLKSIDPDFQTPVVGDYLRAAGIVFLLAIPMILALQLPAYAQETQNPLWNWVTLGIFALYLLGVIGCFLLLVKKRAVSRLSQLWYREE